MNKQQAYEKLQQELHQHQTSLDSIDSQLAELQRQRRAAYERKRYVEQQLPRAKNEAMLEKELQDQTTVDFDKIQQQLTDLKLATPELLPFQVEDCAFILDRIAKGHRGFLNANAMGLGKTLETIAVLKVLPNAKVLWLTKKSLVSSTSEEARKWGYPLLPLPQSSKEETLDVLLSLSSVGPIGVITNYETVNSPKLLAKLKAFGFTVIVVDEVHKLKGGANYGRKSMVWENTNKLINESDPRPFPFFLTGSPVQNKPGDMWAYLHIFDPERFPTLRRFERMFETDFDNQAIIKILTPNMVRRRKDEVGIQMPFKSYTKHVIEMPNPSPEGFTDLYNALLDDMFASFPDGELSISAVIAQLHYLRALALAPGKLEYNYRPVNPLTLERADTPIRQHATFKPSFPKLDYAFELACEILDEGENVIIWSAQYNAPLHYFKKLFTELGYTTEIIDGETPNARVVEQKFQQNEIRVLLCNQKAAAEGFNFHCTEQWPGGASQAIFLDRWYNPAINEQAEDRIWRVGSIKPVQIHVLHLENSVDELIDAITTRKAEFATTLMENEKFRPNGSWKAYLENLFKRK